MVARKIYDEDDDDNIHKSLLIANNGYETSVVESRREFTSDGEPLQCAQLKT